MIFQHPYLLFFCDINLESESSPDSVRDWEVFWGGGKTKLRWPHSSCPPRQEPL